MQSSLLYLHYEHLAIKQERHTETTHLHQRAATSYYMIKTAVQDYWWSLEAINITVKNVLSVISTAWNSHTTG